MIKIKNYIDGKWCDAASNKTAIRKNPANNDETVGEYPVSGIADVRQAIEAAQKAFSIWKNTPAPQRSQILQKVIDLIKTDIDECAHNLTLEHGKTLREAKGEINRGLAELEYFVGEGCRIEGRHIPASRKGVVCYTKREPIGVISAIVPWNFPFIPVIREVAPAIVYGDTVVLKPATLTPFTSAHVVKCFERAGLPAGVLNMVVGSGSAVGRELVENPLVKGITFTGSGEVGRTIAEGAARHHARLQLEMGGKNPAVVFESADLQDAAAQIFGRAFGSCGQVCMAISRVIVHESVADELCKLLKVKAEEAIVGSGLESNSTMGPLVSEEHLKKVLGYVEKGVQEGAELLTGGNRLTGPKYDKGNFMSPTIFANVSPDSVIAREEIFGPVLSVLTFSNFEEAIEICNSVNFGLAATGFTKRFDEALAFVDKAQAGMVQTNLATYCEPYVPFGGVKGSGFGPYSIGYTTVDFYTDQKSVYLYA